MYFSDLASENPNVRLSNCYISIGPELSRGIFVVFECLPFENISWLCDALLWPYRTRCLFLPAVALITLLIHLLYTLVTESQGHQSHVKARSGC